MNKSVLIMLFIIFPFICAKAQYKSNQGIGSTAANFYNGFTDAAEWYDIPIAFAFFGNKIINQNNIGDQIVIHPSDLEIQLTNELAVPGIYSAGSMDKDRLPWAVFISRMTINLTLNLFTESNVTSDDYKVLLLFQKSLIYTHTLTEIVKNIVKRERPSGYDNRSFFSGHTSTTFAASTFLYLELRDFYKSWKVTKNDDFMSSLFNVSSFGLLYGWAGYVGYSRMRDNKHYLSDILIGAAAGTLVSYFVYNLYLGSDKGMSNNIGISAIGNNISLNYTMKF